MTKIHLNIEADTTHELQTAILNLADFCSLKTPEAKAEPETAAVPETAMVPEAPATTRPSRSRTSTKTAPAPEVKPEPTPESEPAPEPVKEEPTAEPEPTAASAPEPPTVTTEQVRERLKQISKSGKQPQVKALIESYGVTALSDVSADKLPELLAKAEAL